MRLVIRILICLFYVYTLQACGQKYTYSDKYDLYFKFDQEDIHSQSWNISRLSWLSSIPGFREEGGPHLITFFHPEKHM